MPKSRLKTDYRHDLKKLPPLNVDRFIKLRRILWLIYNKNESGCAKILGISRPTWVKWDTNPPVWPYWNYVLELVIQNAMRRYNPAEGIQKDSFIRARSKSKARDHLSRIRKLIAELDEDQKLLNHIFQSTYTVYGAEEHLRRLLLREPRLWSEIRKAANSGGYTVHQLRRAALALGVIKEQTGYGADKDSIWSLPTVPENFV